MSTDAKAHRFLLDKLMCLSYNLDISDNICREDFRWQKK